MEKVISIFDSDEEDDRPLRITSFFQNRKRRSGSSSSKQESLTSTVDISSISTSSLVVNDVPLCEDNDVEPLEQFRKEAEPEVEVDDSNDSIQILADLKASPVKSAVSKCSRDEERKKRLKAMFEDSDEDDANLVFSKPSTVTISSDSQSLEVAISSSRSSSNSSLQSIPLNSGPFVDDSSDDALSPSGDRTLVASSSNCTPGKGKRSAKKRVSERAKLKELEKVLELEELATSLASPPVKKAKSKRKTPVKGTKARSEVRAQKQLELEEAKKQKELSKQISLKNSLINCRAQLDSNLIDSFFSKEELHRKFSDYEINYRLAECTRMENTVTWSRKTKLATGETVEQEEDQVLVVIEFDDFIPMVSAYKWNEDESLIAFAKNVLNQHGKEKHVNIIVHRLSQYFRSKQTKANQEFTAAITGKTKKSRRKSLGLPDVNQSDIDEALVALEMQFKLQTGRTARVMFTDTADDMTTQLAAMTKAIAESPMKRKRSEQMGFEWYIQADAVCTVDPRTRDDCVRLWKRQLQQFPKVSADVSEAIVSFYPNLNTLLEAYKKKGSKREASSLLENITVGKLNRRIGPEMSKRMHMFFSSADGHIFLAS
ncbi:Crossover junction endonuclease EME1 [Halotydeus destructor]|nr:Crossover junction endonuclease EME1 [Halotydeus destructor]